MSTISLVAVAKTYSEWARQDLSVHAKLLEGRLQAVIAAEHGSDLAVLEQNIQLVQESLFQLNKGLLRVLYTTLTETPK